MFANKFNGCCFVGSNQGLFKSTITGVLMGKFFQVFFVLLFPGLLAAQKPLTVSEDLSQLASLTFYSSFFEDPQDTVNVKSLIAAPEKYPFKPVNAHAQNVGFTQSAFWIRFDITYSGKTARSLLLEAARPVTNEVVLFNASQPIENAQFIGDDYRFDQKKFPHHSAVFPLVLSPGLNSFFLKLKSDGEVLHLNVQLFSQEAFYKQDYYTQAFYGFFYGILFLVIITNLFLYYTIKERPFLYYIFYVLSIGGLQLSLDGFAFEFIFPAFPYLANICVIFFAGLSVLFITNYAKTFLHIPQVLPKINQIYTVVMSLAVLITIGGFFKGDILAMMYPAVNVLSLIATALVIFSIFRLSIKKQPVSLYFILAISVLTIGTFVFILTNANVLDNNFWTSNSLKIGNGIEVVLLSFSIASKYRILEKEKMVAQQETLKNLIEINDYKDQSNIRLENEVAERTKELQRQKELVETKNQDITKSLQYARTLQKAAYPSMDLLKNNVADFFIFHLPKDIVSGDFYWFIEKDNFLYAAVADCTGHGVPGAIVSMIGIDALFRIVNYENVCDVGQILQNLDVHIKTALGQSQDSIITEHGMDIAIVKIDKSARKLSFSGANRPLCFVTENEDGTVLKEVKPTKRGIGGSTNLTRDFDVNNLEFTGKTWIYLFSDGYADQFGGPDSKKLMKKRMNELLLAGYNSTGEEQKNLYLQKHREWKGSQEQVDDICMMGIRI